MITKRTLEQWRREALVYQTLPAEEILSTLAKENDELHQRILRLTAELLDQHLMKR